MMIAEAYGEYRTKLYTLALNKTGNKEEAEDIVHDVFCSLSKEAAKIFNLRAWLYVATRNAIIDYIRRRNRQQNAYALLETEHGDMYHLNPENLLIIRERFKEFKRVSQRLREIDREILGYDAMGLSSREIAGKVGLGEVNVRVRLHCTRRTLQEMLA